MVTHILLIIVLIWNSPITCMDTVPNEVVRMFLEHMTHKQRKSVARVSKIWNFLVNTLPIPAMPPKRFEPTLVVSPPSLHFVDAEWKKSTNPIDIFLDCPTIQKRYPQIEKHLKEQEQRLGNIGVIINKRTPIEDIKNIFEERKNVSAIRFEKNVSWKQAVYDSFFQLFKSYPQVNHIELSIPEDEDLILDHFAQNSNIDSAAVNTLFVPSFLKVFLSKNTTIKQIRILGLITKFDFAKHMHENDTLRILDCSDCCTMDKTLVKQLIEAVQHKPNFSLILHEKYKSQFDNAQNVEFINPYK